MPKKPKPLPPKRSLKKAPAKPPKPVIPPLQETRYYSLLVGIIGMRGTAYRDLEDLRRRTAEDASPAIFIMEGLLTSIETAEAWMTKEARIYYPAFDPPTCSKFPSPKVPSRLSRATVMLDSLA